MQIDWQLAIERNKAALLRLLMLLVAKVGGGVDDAAPIIARAVYLEILRLLRPAEAALRRLIVIAARGVTVRLRPASVFPQSIARGQGHKPRIPAFVLLDPLRQVGPRPLPVTPGIGPNMRVIGMAYTPMGVLQKAGAKVDATRLCRRIVALRHALETIPKQVQRLAQWRARRALRAGPGRVSPMRSGRPPGHRARAMHPIDLVLRDCDWLARYALMPPDT